MRSCRAAASLGSERHGGLVFISGLLQQRDTSSLTRQARKTWWKSFLPQEQLMELFLGMDEEPTEILQVRNQETTARGDSVCYRLLNQKEQTDEALHRQVGGSSHSQVLVLVEDFNHFIIYWRDNTTGHKLSRRFLECVDNFLTQLIEKPMGEVPLQELILIKSKGFVVGVKVKGCLGKLKILNSMRAGIGIFKDLLSSRA